MPNKVPGDAGTAGLQIDYENHLVGALAGARMSLCWVWNGPLRFKLRAQEVSWHIAVGKAYRQESLGRPGGLEKEQQGERNALARNPWPQTGLGARAAWHELREGLSSRNHLVSECPLLIPTLP